MNGKQFISEKNALFTEEEFHLFEKYGLHENIVNARQRFWELKEENHRLSTKLHDVEHDLSLARDAQMKLLPTTLPKVGEIEFAARFFPSKYVSGDTYNVFRLDESHIGLYHIDIAGHGLTAALFSVSLSQMLNANISDKNLLKTTISNPPYYKINPPDKVMALLNDEKFFDRYGFYYTMIYMIIDIKKGICRYSRAGHNPPIILRTNGQMEQSQAGGLPIGWNFDRVDPVISIELAPDDRIFLYSDGVCEALNLNGKMFGVDRLMKSLKNNLVNSLDQTLDGSVSDLKDFCSSETFEDDISLLGITYLGNSK